MPPRTPLGKVVVKLKALDEALASEEDVGPSEIKVLDIVECIVMLMLAGHTGFCPFFGFVTAPHVLSALTRSNAERFAVRASGEGHAIGDRGRR